MAETTEKGGFGRGWKWLLVLSLALNLVVVAMIGGAVWRFSGSEGSPRHRMADAPLSGAAFVRALPRDSRRALGRALRAERHSIPGRSERRALYSRMVAALRADPFEAAVAEEILAAHGAAVQAAQARAQAAWLGIVAQMSAAERAAVADRLEEALSRRRSRQGGKE